MKTFIRVEYKKKKKRKKETMNKDKKKHRADFHIRSDINRYRLR